MKTGALLYIDDGLSDSNLVFNDKYLPEELKNRINSIDTVTEVYFSVPQDYSGKLNDMQGVLVRLEKDDVGFWKRCFKETGLDHIVKIFADSPFLDLEIITEMIDAHLKYLAEFTYSENLPDGYSCEIISGELMDAIPDSNEKMLPLGKVIRSNINQFDVELYYKDPDIRDKRILFRSGEDREKRILENLLSKAGDIPGYSQVKDLVENNPETLYISPSYLEIELTGRCDLDCLFCYRNTLKEAHPDIELNTFKKILSDMKSFELEYSVCFGGSGEPLMHKNFYEIMDLTLGESSVKMVVIETNGIHADDNFRNYIAGADNSRIKIIVNINGMNEETYNKLHRKDLFKTVSQNILSLKDALTTDDCLYIQIMKINETEEFIDSYYDFWENYKIPIILQKQNTYLSRIDDRRFSDLTPIDRTPCWHLQRDLYVLSDGTVSFCKEDIDGEHARGNVNNESLTKIWNNSSNDFLNNYREQFSLKPDCKSCDEWYTFNL